MNSKYPLIAAAVAAALSLSSLVHAQPVLSQAENPTYSLVIAGSSAAKSSIAAAIGNDLCTNSSLMTTFSSTGASTNFFAYSCIPPNTTAANSELGSLINGSNVFTIYYRDEGGSVTGALPLASTVATTSNPDGTQGLQQLLRLDLATCTGAAPTYSCAITCTNGTNPAAPVCGVNDSWAGATVSDHVQMGVTDVEPAQLIGLDYPSDYVSNNFGSATASQLATLSHKTFVDQVFGVFINTEGTSITSTDLSTEAYANILLGANPSTPGFTDWSEVPDAETGAPMASSPQAIVRIDREPGSGTRTSANIFFLDYPCSSSSGIVDSVNATTGAAEVDNYSTGNELTAAEGTPGAVAYASIDNWYSSLSSPSSAQTLYTNMALATLNGVFPSNKAAAAGAYDYWFEATTVENPDATIVPAATTGKIISWIQNDMPQIGSVPDAADIDAIPGKGATPNVAKVPLVTNGQTTVTKEAYINPYTRNGGSCNVPSEAVQNGPPA